MIATKVVIDDMGNSVREAYGKLPTSAYFIGKGGKIYHRQAWARPDECGPLLKAEGTDARATVPIKNGPDLTHDRSRRFT